MDTESRLGRDIDDQIEAQINRVREIPEAAREGMVLAGWVTVAVWIDPEGRTAMDLLAPAGQLEPTTRGLLALAIEEDWDAD